MAQDYQLTARARRTRQNANKRLCRAFAEIIAVVALGVSLWAMLWLGYLAGLPM
ncbi:MAG: hypothetical protein LIP02_07245 [Bacteroidales bacterium]|nr:hypothetical protein [Bacteroidales bacterium]